MIFIDTQDFFDKAAHTVRLSREAEKACAMQAKQGDSKARERLIESYLPIIALHVKRAGKEMQGLELIYRLLHVLEREVDAFDFSQDSETFTHRLGLRCKQALVEYVADL